MLTAIAIAHLAPTTWLTGTPTTPTEEPTTGSLIRRSYLPAAAGGTITATLYGLTTGTAFSFDYTSYLKWTLGGALPLAACATLIAATAPRIPAHALPLEHPPHHRHPPTRACGGDPGSSYRSGTPATAPRPCRGDTKTPP
ncbi:hypothetical protein AB0K20_30565 [Micromonospora matsumotoense]|uniref:hypothetical protein n=1 Tax=Micromonospora matsumotoense TaxID=121616 RepID=UPI00344160CB